MSSRLTEHQIEIIKKHLQDKDQWGRRRLSYDQIGKLAGCSGTAACDVAHGKNAPKTRARQAAFAAAMGGAPKVITAQPAPVAITPANAPQATPGRRKAQIEALTEEIRLSALQRLQTRLRAQEVRPEDALAILADLEGHRG